MINMTHQDNFILLIDADDSFFQSIQDDLKSVFGAQIL